MQFSMFAIDKLVFNLHICCSMVLGRPSQLHVSGSQFGLPCPRYNHYNCSFIKNSPIYCIPESRSIIISLFVLLSVLRALPSPTLPTPTLSDLSQVITSVQQRQGVAVIEEEQVSKYTYISLVPKPSLEDSSWCTQEEVGMCWKAVLTHCMGERLPGDEAISTCNRPFAWPFYYTCFIVTFNIGRAAWFECTVLASVVCTGY